MTEWTPLPGERADAELEADVIARFLRRYRGPEDGRPTHLPTWVLFPAGERVDVGVFERPGFDDNAAIYFFFENARQLFTATPRQVRDYFARRNPWETDWDLYVFDTDLRWCVAVTHEQMGGCAVILVGSL